jgi:hypothetical protein
MTFTSLQNDLQSYLERGTVQDPLVFNQFPELINLAERRIASEMKVLGFVVPAVFTMQAGLAVYPKPDRWRKTVSLNVGAPKAAVPQFTVSSIAPGAGPTAVLQGSFGTSSLVGQNVTITGFVLPQNNGSNLPVSVWSTTSITVSLAGSTAETDPAVATQVSVTIGTAVRTQVYPRSYEYVREYWPDDTQTNLTVYGAPGVPKFYADYNYQNYIVTPTPDMAYPAELVYYEQPALLDATNQSNFITQYMPNLLLYASLLECTPFLKKDERISTWQAMYDRAAATYNEQSSNEILDRSSTRQET